jgi:subtilisin
VGWRGPGARLWAVKVLKYNGTGTNSDVLCGLDWVAKHTGVIDVVNMSLVGPVNQALGSCRDEAFHAAICELVSKGVTVIVAAGNDSQDTPNWRPARYPEVITVSALADNDGQPGALGDPNNWSPCDIYMGQADDHLASFSNYGEAVDIATRSWPDQSRRGGGAKIDTLSCTTGVTGGGATAPCTRGCCRLLSPLDRVRVERGRASPLGMSAFDRTQLDAPWQRERKEA